MDAFSRYDKLVESQASEIDMAVAEHQILLSSQAMATELTSPGEFVLDLWLLGISRWWGTP